MQFSNLLSLAALGATIATAVPTLETRTLETRARANCTKFSSPSAGTYCLDRPSDCTATYTVQAGDNCHNIPSAFGNFTPSILWYWNPDIGRGCYGLIAGVPICIATPWYRTSPPVFKPYGTIETAAKQPAIDVPVPIVGRTNSTCKKYELAGGGVFAGKMISDNNITAQQFCTWNPSVNCTNLGVQADYWYAVSC